MIIFRNIRMDGLCDSPPQVKCYLVLLVCLRLASRMHHALILSYKLTNLAREDVPFFDLICSGQGFE